MPAGAGHIRAVLTALLILLAIIVLIALGVVGLAAKVLWWILVGLIIGALARLVLPGIQAIGWIGTTAAGIGGALIGGIAGDALGGHWLVELVLAIAAAALLIAAFTGTRRAYA